MKNTKVLHLTLHRRYFDQIASGIKKEEYRTLKPYWKKRLTNPAFHNCDHYEYAYFDIDQEVFRQDYTHIKFKNGYSANSPKMLVELTGIYFGEGKKEWGAKSNEIYFILSLGRILKLENYGRAAA